MDCTDRTARTREKNRRGAAGWRARDPERAREYLRQRRAANPERYRGHWSKAYNTRKTTAHERSNQRFDIERELERSRHLQIKTAQLLRSIIRGGVIADHTAWDWDMADLVRYVADHVPVASNY
jgi:hypothetical protein